MNSNNRLALYTSTEGQPVSEGELWEATQWIGEASLGIRAACNELVAHSRMSDGAGYGFVYLIGKGVHAIEELTYKIALTCSDESSTNGADDS